MPHGDTPPQYLRRLAGPVFSPLDGPSVFAAWRPQCFCRLAGPVFIPLGACWFLLKERRLVAGGVYGR